MRWLVVALATVLSLALPAVELTASGSAAAPAAAPVRTDPQCTGDGFTATSRDQEVADELMAGRMTLANFSAWQLPDDLQWTEDPFSDNNWVFQLNLLHWADPLRRAGLATGNQAMLDRYESIIHDWVDDNPVGAPRSKFAWYDMADGFRAIALVCLAAALPDEPQWLADAIDTHAEMLSDPDRFASTSNHGLYQNLGLLALGCSRDVAPWRDLAVRRATTMLEYAVDEEGVTNEGSVEYQASNHSWYLQLAERLRRCGLPRIQRLDRVDLMPEFLAQATQPDGNLVAWGDSSAIDRGVSIPGTGAEYAMSEGRSGPKPDRTFAVYQRGYAFSRSGWFDTQPASRQSLASIRFGAPKSTAVHGHEDSGALGYFAYGNQVLWQPGLWGGAGGPERRYVLSNQAHNTVDITGAAYDPTVPTPLVAATTTPAADLVTVDSTALQYARWRRTMVHVKKPELLVVDDRVSQLLERPVLQRWHLGADRRVTASSCGRADTSGPGSNSTFLWIGGCPRLSLAVGQTSPLLGWRSPHVNEFVPSPTLVARTSGFQARMTAIIVPRPSGVRPADVEVLWSRLDQKGGAADVRIGRRVHRVTFTSSTSSVRLERSPSKTSATLQQAARIRADKPVRVLVKVTTATGQTATGRVSLAIGGRKLTARLRHGQASLRLQHLSAGRYRLRSAYEGSGSVRPSRTAQTFVVKKPR
jgi:hypothetical protein